jgi:hypothetical protein
LSRKDGVLGQLERLAGGSVIALAPAVRKMPSAAEELHMQHGFARHAYTLTFVTRLLVTLFATSFSTAAYAQEPRGYVEGSGALSRLTGSSTSAGLDGEVGVKVSPNYPSVRFLYQDGTTPSGSAASVGDDITADIVSNGLFTAPTPTTSLTLRTGGGVQVPISKHLLCNIGYSVSRISADTPIHAQDFTFGLGIKF